MALVVTVALSSCGGGGKPAKKEDLKPAPFTGAKGEMKLMTLDPGHFHAALVQKIALVRCQRDRPAYCEESGIKRGTSPLFSSSYSLSP